MRLALLGLFLAAVTAPAATVTYRMEFAVPSLPITSGGPFVPDPLPASVMRIDYTGDFPAAGPYTFFLDDARITAVDPPEYAGYPLRLANSYISFSSTALQLIAFEFGPPLPSPDGVIVNAQVPDAASPGSFISSLAIGTGANGISGQAGCQQCLVVTITPTPEPATALLLAVPLGLAILRRPR
ncbi:MAG: hypothetical protein SGI92_13815 [Bryobacteraceae bacterium]|nr:hypothetical protein [Bryobacteraceae bacterium]